MNITEEEIIEILNRYGEHLNLKLIDIHIKQDIAKSIIDKIKEYENKPCVLCRIGLTHGHYDSKTQHIEHISGLSHMDLLYHHSGKSIEDFIKDYEQ